MKSQVPNSDYTTQTEGGLPVLLGDENCIELRDRSHLCYKSIINYDLDVTNILVVSPQVRYIEVFDITNPRFNEQIWPIPNDFVKLRFHCSGHCENIPVCMGIFRRRENKEKNCHLLKATAHNSDEVSVGKWRG